MARAAVPDRSAWPGLGRFTCARAAPAGSLNSRASAGLPRCPRPPTRTVRRHLARCNITTLPPAAPAAPSARPADPGRSARPPGLLAHHPSNAAGRVARARQSHLRHRRTAESGSAYRLPPCRQMTARMASLQPEPRDHGLQLDGKVSAPARRSDGGGHTACSRMARETSSCSGIRRGDLADLADGFTISSEPASCSLAAWRWP